MASRIIPARTRTWLLGELSLWHRAGIVSEDQVNLILGLYEAPAETARRKQSLAVFTLMAVAAFLVGLAAVLLVGYNWQAMPKAVKLVLIFGTILSTHSLGFWLRYVRRQQRWAEIAFFLACIFYGCGIWLVAQIFHIQRHSPDGLWYWALGVLPFALCLDTLLIHALLVGLLATWVGTEILNFGGHWFAGSWYSLPAGCYTLPLLALPGLIWAYRKQSPAAIGLYLPLVAWWLILQPIAWHGGAVPVYVIGAAGALLLALTHCHRPDSSLAEPYRFYGVLLTAGTLLVLSFSDFNLVLLREGSAPISLVASLLIALGGIGTIVLADRFKSDGIRAVDRDSLPLGSFLKRHWLPVGLMGLMAVFSLLNGLFATHASFCTSYSAGLDRWTAPVLVPTLLANAATIAFALWLIGAGLREERGGSFWIGTGLFVLWAIFRYIDLFANVGGMLGASLMFFLCGTALFAMARFWMHRKEPPHA